MPEKRVLHVIDNLSHGSGVCNVILNYMRYMPDWTFDFVVQQDGDPDLYDEVFRNGGRIEKIPMPVWANIPTYIEQWNALFQKFRYCILHGHLPVTAFLYLHCAKKNNIPIRIMHSHSAAGAVEPLKKLRNAIAKFPIKSLATHFVACSQDAGLYLFGKKITQNHLVILPNAIDIHQYRFDPLIRNSLRAQHAVEDKLLVGHVGRLARSKNQAFLLDIFAEIRKKVPSQLWIIGAGSLRGALDKKAKELGMADDVLFWGAQEHPERILPALDAFVLPSFFEGVPLSALEAQACGVPCVVSDAVSRDIGVTPAVQWKNLALPYKEWAEDILSLKNSCTNQEAIAVDFANSIYNIHRSAGILRDLYEGLYRSCSARQPEK